MEATRETWRDVPGWEGHYQVSDLGRIRTVKPGRERLRKLAPDKGGYLSVVLTRPGQHWTPKVHVLVLLAFVGPRPDGLEARHVDGDQLNNRLSNLAYGTHSENEQDKVRQGTHHNVAKTHCPAGHSYAVHGFVKGDGRRRCRICVVAQRAAFRAAHADELREKDRLRYLARKAER